MAKFIVRKIAKEDIAWGKGTFTIGGQTFTKIDASAIPWIDGTSTIEDVINNKADVGHTHNSADITDLNQTINTAISTHNQDTGAHQDIRDTLNNKADKNHTHTWADVDKTGSKLKDIEDVPDYTSADNKIFVVKNGGIVLDDLGQSDTYKILVDDTDTTPDYIANKVIGLEPTTDNGVRKLTLANYVVRKDTNTNVVYDVSGYKSDQILTTSDSLWFSASDGAGELTVYDEDSYFSCIIRRNFRAAFPAGMEKFFNPAGQSFNFTEAWFSQAGSRDLMKRKQISNIDFNLSPGRDKEIIFIRQDTAQPINAQISASRGIVFTFIGVESTSDKVLLEIPEQNLVVKVTNGDDLVVQALGQTVTFADSMKDQFWFTLVIEKEPNSSNLFVGLDSDLTDTKRQTVDTGDTTTVLAELDDNINVYRAFGCLIIFDTNGIRNILKNKLLTGDLSAFYGRRVEAVYFQ